VGNFRRNYYYASTGGDEFANCAGMFNTVLYSPSGHQIKTKTSLETQLENMPCKVGDGLPTRQQKASGTALKGHLWAGFVWDIGDCDPHVVLFTMLSQHPWTPFSTTKYVNYVSPTSLNTKHAQQVYQNGPRPKGWQRKTTRRQIMCQTSITLAG